LAQAVIGGAASAIGIKPLSTNIGFVIANGSSFSV
jgi:hypothetical protein